MTMPDEILAALRAQEAANETTFLFERLDWPYSPEIDGVVDLADLWQRLLHGPTLTAVKSALRGTVERCELCNGGTYESDDGLWCDCEFCSPSRAALRMLEGE